MQKSLLVIICTVLLPCAALPAATQTDPRLVGFVATPPWNRTGKDFVQAIMRSSKFAIVASKLALERSHDPAVRDIALNMITSHRKLLDDLRSVTDRTFVNRIVTPPPVFDTGQKKMYNLLEISFGPAFDRLYISQQLDAHQELLATVEGYAGRSGVPQLQAFAHQTVPTVRDHLAKLRSIRVNVAVNGRDDRY